MCFVRVCTGLCVCRHVCVWANVYGVCVWCVCVWCMVYGVSVCVCVWCVCVCVCVCGVCVCVCVCVCCVSVCVCQDERGYETVYANDCIHVHEFMCAPC